MITPPSTSPLPPPQSLGLSFSTWRGQQADAITTALGCEAQYQLLQLPTGAGKSGVAVALPRLDPKRTVILTATKGLQDQYTSEAPFLTDIRGAGNYECLAARDLFVRIFRGKYATCDEGPCRIDFTCELKDKGCLYFDQYKSALQAPAVVTSYAYWLSIRRHGRGLGVATRLICDEAHALPEQLMSACRIEIPVYEVSGRVPRTIDGWRSWAIAQKDRMQDRTEDQDAKARKVKFADRLTALSAVDPDTWEWEQTRDGWAFEPVIPRLLMPLLVSPTTTHVVFLSATATLETLELCGLDPDTVETVEYESTFPVEHRPVYLLKTRRIDSRATPDDMDYWRHRIDMILKGRQDRKGIIHSGAYYRSQYLLQHSAYAQSFILPHDRDTGEALERFRNAPPPAVLVSPAVTTGYDFPGDTCRYQIIAKVPFPDTRSRITKARIQANPLYRDHITMQSLVQACGRPVRSKTDWAETFIVDDHARWFIYKSKVPPPTWFLDAVERTTTIPYPLEAA